MKKILPILIFLLCFSLLAGCSAAPVDSPENAATPVEPSDAVPDAEPDVPETLEPEVSASPETPNDVEEVQPPEPELYSDFAVVTEVFDGGQAVTQLILDMREEIGAEDIDLDAIEVMALHTNTKRKITNAYPSDAEGHAQDRGSYLTLELQHNYTSSGGFANSSGTSYYSMSTWTNVLYELDHTVTIGDRLFVQREIINRLEDDFSYETSASGLNYRLYCPAEAAESARPLIIWIHGMGEGGSDNRMQIIGNKACNFASEEIQSWFEGAYVAAPQCPDFWASNFDFVSRSPYADDMVALIEEVIAQNNVDPARVYIGGCSMGGYMTWQTILAKPELFAAAFPVCAAYAPTAEDAQQIAAHNLPVWVIYSADDSTVNPDDFTRPSVATLEAAGADVRVTEFEHVYEDDVLYNGHFSWIYVYNNHVFDEAGTSLMEWLAAQTRK